MANQNMHSDKIKLHLLALHTVLVSTAVILNKHITLSIDETTNPTYLHL